MPLFAPHFKETPNGVFRPVSMRAEMLPLALVPVWAALGILSGRDGIPLAAVDGSMLIFRSHSLSPTKRFPIAGIEQIRVYGLCPRPSSTVCAAATAKASAWSRTWSSSSRTGS